MKKCKRALSPKRRKIISKDFFFFSKFNNFSSISHFSSFVGKFVGNFLFKIVYFLFSRQIEMYHYMPQIFWHDRQGLLSVDIHPRVKDKKFKIVTSSVQKEVWVVKFMRFFSMFTYRYEFGNSSLKRKRIRQFVPCLCISSQI